MHGIGFLKSNIGKQYILPDVVIDINTDFYFLEFILPNNLNSDWDYKQVNGIINYLSQIGNYKVIKSINIEGIYLSEIYKNRVKEVEKFIEVIKKRQFDYNLEDTTTWEENFISIEYQGQIISFSYETKEGELLWGLYNSLETLKREIELGGALYVIYIEIQS